VAPVWSPEGSSIAFTTEGYKGIWIIDLTSGKVKQVTDEYGAGYGFKWSGDSKSILARVSKYEGLRRYNAIKIFYVEAGDSELLSDYRTIMPGLPQFALGDERVFLYSRNKVELFDTGFKAEPLKKVKGSSKIIYLRDDKIAVEDLENNHLEIFEPVKGERVLNLQASPDGNKEAFEIIGGDMFVMNIDGSGLVDLGKGSRPKWSPDSQYIIYMITEDDGHKILSSDIYKIRIDGSEKTNLTGSADKIEMNPCWSPDGKMIAYDLQDEGAVYILEISSE
jgi:Tol biopolymer transport system component